METLELITESLAKLHGYGNSDGYGYSNGYGDGYGDGDGYGNGNGYGYGNGKGKGYGYGDGDGDGYGNGNGYGYGNGNGYGYGYGYGNSYGDGYGNGEGDGYGYGYGVGNYNLIPFYQQNITSPPNTIIAFWRCHQTNTPSNGGLNTVAKEGLTEEISGPLEICSKNALHATLQPKNYKGSNWWLVAMHKPFQIQDDKIGSLKRTFLKNLGVCPFN